MIVPISRAEDHECTGISGVCNQCGKDIYQCENCKIKAALTPSEVMPWTIAHFGARPECAIQPKAGGK